MLQFLQGEVGIRKQHCQQIVKHIRAMQQQEQVKPAERRVTVAVEGNISAGKSSFLKMLNDARLNMQEEIEVVPEPVSKWQSAGEQGFNVLEAFYNEPERYAYTFQNYVFVTRMMQERETRQCKQDIRLLERSVFSDRMVFVRAVHEANWMTDMELNIYDSWFEPIIASQPSLVPDGFIYLRADPDTCLRRMHLRSRSEEASVSMEYLEGLHEKHESWMFGEKQRMPLSIPLQIATPSLPNTPEVPDILKGKVFYLDKGKQTLLHPSINARPLLVLDCNQDIDVDKDLDAKRHYMEVVRAYCRFVRDANQNQGPHLWPQRPPVSQALDLGRGPTELDTIFSRFDIPQVTGMMQQRPDRVEEILRHQLEGLKQQLAASQAAQAMYGGSGAQMAGMR
ncbi:hypothetical protein WJX72_005140 [[Myrmecia] bisecta]|uniref:Deoxynucleoside kinase domain-containing protein n=1 Tax=[Myrmecia] bisecta TaxID=41462 RepID=A0AAW1PT27_9CHLO